MSHGNCYKHLHCHGRNISNRMNDFDDNHGGNEYEYHHGNDPDLKEIWVRISGESVLKTNLIDECSG